MLRALSTLGARGPWAAPCPVSAASRAAENPPRSAGQVQDRARWRPCSAGILRELSAPTERYRQYRQTVRAPSGMCDGWGGGAPLACVLGRAVENCADPGRVSVQKGVRDRGTAEGMRARAGVLAERKALQDAAEHRELMAWNKAENQRLHELR